MGVHQARRHRHTASVHQPRVLVAILRHYLHARAYRDDMLPFDNHSPIGDNPGLALGRTSLRSILVRSTGHDLGGGMYYEGIVWVHLRINSEQWDRPFKHKDAEFAKKTPSLLW